MAKYSICPTCGKQLTVKNVYKSSAQIYKSLEYVPFCKECIWNTYEKYLEELDNEKKAIYITCKVYNIPFSDLHAESTLKEDNIIASGKGLADKFKIYMKNINSIGVHNGDGMDFDFLSDFVSSVKTDKEGKIDFKSINMAIDFDVTPEIIMFWGKNFTKEEYKFLEENYELWISECKSDTLAERTLYKEICLKSLEIRKTREEQKNVDKQVEALQKLMESANVKPKDVNSANDPTNSDVLGMVIKDIEMYRPAEYFEDKKLYSDFDSLKDYFDRLILRPMKNLLLGTRDFDKEFNLSDSDD